MPPPTRDPAQHYQHTEIGYNTLMSNVLAAIGRGQLHVLEDRVRRKREIFEVYCQALGDLPGIDFMLRRNKRGCAPGPGSRKYRIPPAVEAHASSAGVQKLRAGWRQRSRGATRQGPLLAPLNCSKEQTEGIQLGPALRHRHDHHRP